MLKCVDISGIVAIAAVLGVVALLGYLTIRLMKAPGGKK